MKTLLWLVFAANAWAGTVALEGWITPISAYITSTDDSTVFAWRDLTGSYLGHMPDGVPRIDSYMAWGVQACAPPVVCPSIQFRIGNVFGTGGELTLLPQPNGEWLGTLSIRTSTGTISEDVSAAMILPSPGSIIHSPDGTSGPWQYDIAATEAATATPEPNAAILIGVGLILIGWMARKAI